MARRRKNQQLAPTAAIEQLELAYDQQIALSELEAHLWESANILRGPVDAADFKTYIFPLLFFKRICDVYDEEFQSALEESGGDRDYAQFPENHCFQIPDGYHWRDIREKTSNVGQALQQAMREIEKANQRNQQRDAFATDYLVLAQLWEILSPDACLQPYIDDYRWLTQVYESVKPPSGQGKLLWHALGAKTVELIHEHVHVEAV